MPETPSSEPNEQELREAEIALTRWVDHLEYAAGGICAETGLVVLIDYRNGILTPNVNAKNLTTEQRTKIQKWKDGLPDLTINFHK